MSSIESIKSLFGSYAKDIKLNLSRVLSEDGSPELTHDQRWGTLLSCAYATKNAALIEALQLEASSHIGPEIQEAAKAAATIMAMNNIYYRFVHFAQDAELKQLPAGLRMQIIGNPGIDKTDFELFCLAVSAINGCEECVRSHIHQALTGGISKVGVQSAVRIASVLHAASQALVIG